MTTLINFDKMHGLGNDFMVINGLEQPLPSQQQMARLSDRHRGVGFDQLLYITASADESVDFHYQIFNADGSEVEQCGNGVRCVAAFIKRHQLSTKTTLKLTCLAGDIITHFTDDGQVKVNMGCLKRPIEVVTISPFANQTFSLVSIDVGNPHAVLFVDDIDHFELEKLGQWCNASSQFPNGVNLEIVAITSAEQINIRVFERGVGETNACGTGACAAAIAAKFQHQQSLPTRVQLPGGILIIDWHGNATDPIWMTGPANFVFSGQVSLAEA